MTERPTAEDELVIDGDEDAATRPDAPLEIDLEPPGVPGAAQASEPTPAGEQVGRFVAESEPLGSDGKVLPDIDEDSPTIALHTMRLLDPDVEELDTHSTVRLRSLPPPPPPVAHVAPRAEPPLSNVVLGPGLSMRGEITERVHLIPQTHPMANSIAPGGSPLSVSPPRRPSLRWQMVLGALALVGLGAGASHYLQSWGEQHAAGVRDGHPEEAAFAGASSRPAAATTGAPPATPSEALSAAPPATTAPRSPASQAAAPGSAVPEAAAELQQLPGAAPPTTAPDAPRPRDLAPGSGAGAARSASGGAIQLAVGAAAIRTPPGLPFRPTIGVVNAAIESVREQVRTCVGDTHGIADVVLTVRSTGVISHALVQGAFAGSSAGSCIARTLRGARVAPFRKPVVRIQYPLKL